MKNLCFFGGSFFKWKNCWHLKFLMNQIFGQRPLISPIVGPYFLNMIDRCPNIWFIKNSKCEQFFHLKKKPPKKHKIFIFLKGCYFVMGSPIDMNVDVFWETSVGFLKSVVLQLFPKYSQSNVNLNVKSRSKFNCL